MRLFCWIFLAGCVGASGLSSPSTLASSSQTMSSKWLGVGTEAARVVRADLPASPDRAPAPVAILPDFDPEPREDDEVWLVLAAGLDRRPASLLTWCPPHQTHPFPHSTLLVSAWPKVVPIRC